MAGCIPVNVSAIDDKVVTHLAALVLVKLEPLNRW